MTSKALLLFLTALSLSIWTCATSPKKIVIHNCVSVTPYGVCSQCDVGYYVDNKGQCQGITVANCIRADVDGVCTSCVGNYHLDASKRCQEKITSKCTRANGNFVCVACNKGYHLFEGKCIE